VTKDDQEHILEVLGRMFRENVKGEIPHMRSLRLEGDAIMYVCSDQQTGQWLIIVTKNHRLGYGARPMATDTRNLPKPVKVALRTKNKCAKCPGELLKLITDLNPGLLMKHWRVLER
jgi:hypothetical protein